MPHVIDITHNVAENIAIEIGRAIDRLKIQPLDSLAKIELVNDYGEFFKGYQVIKNLAIHLDLLAEAVIEFETEQYQNRNYNEQKPAS